MNTLFTTWLFLYGSAIFAISPWGSARRLQSTIISLMFLAVFVYQLRELPALGDAGFYLGQAKTSLEFGVPKYPLAIIYSSAISSAVMNIVITIVPLMSQFYSPFFVIPSFALGGGASFRAVLFLSSTVSMYFLKPNYMDFYPVAIAAGVIAILFHFKTYDRTSNATLTIAGATSGLAIASHLILLMIPLAFVVHLLFQDGRWKKRVTRIVLYSMTTFVLFRFATIALSQLNWPMVPGNSTGGGDEKYLAKHLLNRDQIKQGIKVFSMSLLGPMLFLFCSGSRKALAKYCIFGSSLCIIYVLFLLLYGFDLGLIPDLDLQLFPGAVILGAALTIARRERILLTWTTALYCSPIAIYCAHTISTLPEGIVAGY